MTGKKGTVLPNGYVLGMGRQSLALTESQIRYAMKNAPSNRQAAAFLRVSFNSYKKYALQYIDSETGLSLWELQKQKKKHPRGQDKKPRTKARKLLSDIFDGKYPDYPITQLKNRLSKVGNGLDPPFEYCCHICGYKERRMSDGKIPLILVHLDDDWKNHRRENLRFTCFNCYHNNRGNFRGTQPQFRIERLKQHILNKIINEINPKKEGE